MRKHFQFGKSLRLLAGPLLLACLSAKSLLAAPPNIIFILTDDLGWGDLGVMFQKERAANNNRSQPWELTPNLDRFAAGGVVLTDH